MIATRSPSAHARHAGPDRHDVAGELVPEDLRVLRAGQRVRLDGRHDRAGDVLVQVGAADAAGRRPGRRPRPGPGAGGSATSSIRRSCAAWKRSARIGYDPSDRHGTIRSARRRAKRSVNEDSAVADAEEAEPPAVPHVGERLDRASEVGVRVPPRGERVDVEVAQAVTAHDLGPDLAGIGHLLLERRGLAVERHRLDPSAAASRGHSRRQRKTSPLTMLSAWFAAAGVVAAHTRWSASRRGVGDVGDRLPLLARAREVEAAAGLAADRRVDGERHAHVHRVAERPADQRVRPVHGPREPVALGGGEEDVLLDVVEVLVRQAGLILGERRVRLGLARRPRTGRGSASAR